MENEVDDEASQILKDKIKASLKRSKNGKALRPDQIPVETLKYINDDTLGILLHQVNKIYKTGNIPDHDN